MTVSTTSNRVSYAGNGVTTAFSFPNLFFADSDLVVLLVNDTTGASTTQTLTTHYTVSGAANPAGGTVTMLTAPASGYTLVIYRSPALTQTIDLVNGDAFDVETGVERGFDKNVLIAQRLYDLLSRSSRLADSDTSGADPTLPTPTANNLLGWNSTADGLENKVAADLSLSTVSAFINTLLDDSTAAAARTTLGAVGLTGNETIAGNKILTGDNTNSGNNTNSGIENCTGHTKFSDGIGPAYINNISITPSVATNALTVALKGKNASDLSSTNPGEAAFRNSTAATGPFSVVTATAAASVVAPAGATLGFMASETGYIYAYLLNNAGTMELALSGSSHWDEGTLQSTTAIDTSSDSKLVLYSTTARSNVAIRYVGRILIQTGSTAGNWSNAHTELTPGLEHTRYKKGWNHYAAYTPSAVATLDVPLPSGYSAVRATFTLAPATDDVKLYMRLSEDAGATFASGTGYDSSFSCLSEAGSAAVAVVDAGAQWALGQTTGSNNAIGNAAGEGISATITIYNYQSASVFTSFSGGGEYSEADGNHCSFYTGGRYNSAVAHNYLRFLFSSGNIASGTVVIEVLVV